MEMFLMQIFLCTLGPTEYISAFVFTIFSYSASFIL